MKKSILVFLFATVGICTVQAQVIELKGQSFTVQELDSVLYVQAVREMENEYWELALKKNHLLFEKHIRQSISNQGFNIFKLPENFWKEDLAQVDSLVLLDKKYRHITDSLKDLPQDSLKRQDITKLQREAWVRLQQAFAYRILDKSRKEKIMIPMTEFPNLGISDYEDPDFMILNNQMQILRSFIQQKVNEYYRKKYPSARY